MDDDGVSSDSGSDRYRNLGGVTCVIMCLPLSRTDLTLIFDYLLLLFIIRQTEGINMGWVQSDSGSRQLGLVPYLATSKPGKKLSDVSLSIH